MIEATDAEDVGALGDVRQRFVVEVSPSHSLPIAIRNLTLHLGQTAECYCWYGWPTSLSNRMQKVSGGRKRFYIFYCG